jgi:single-stranded DNA-binding protein
MNDPRSIYQNYFVLSGQVSDIQNKQTKEGKPYATATALLFTGVGKERMPVKVVALDDSSSDLKEGTSTLVSRLGYEEQLREGKKILRFLLFLYRVEPVETGKPRNLALLSLRLGKEVVTGYSKNGKMWARVRAAFDQGKDKEGGYRPSLWLDLKAFASKDGDQSAPVELSGFKKGDRVNVTGRIEYGTYQGKPQLSLVATKIEPIETPEKVQPSATDNELANSQVLCQ